MRAYPVKTHTHYIWGISRTPKLKSAHVCKLDVRIKSSQEHGHGHPTKFHNEFGGLDSGPHGGWDVI